MMKTCLAVIAVLAATPSWAAPSDEDTIKQSVQSFVESWNKHDIAGMAGHWTDSGDLINPAGRVAHGKTEIEKLFTDEHSTVMKASHASMEVASVQMLGDGLAFVDVEMKINGMMSPEGKAMQPMPLHVAMVMKKDGGSWKLNNARPYHLLPPPPPHGKPGAKTAKK
jgi:uncharacterized protein (TIGR02246 family)